MKNESQQGNQLRINGGLAEIEFSYPPHNSLTLKGLKDLSEKFGKLSADERIRVIVVKSSGNRAFCAGANFNELTEVETLEEGIEFFGGFASLFYEMTACPKPILCRVQGKAVGGALGIIACSDLAFATRFSEIKLSELNVGIGPFVVGPPIENKIGTGNLSKMAFSPRRFFPASWAETIGMYAGVFEDAGEMDEAIRIKTEELMEYNPQAIRQIKASLMPDMDAFGKLLKKRRELSAELVLTDFTQKRLRELLG